MKRAAQGLLIVAVVFFGLLVKAQGTLTDPILTNPYSGETIQLTGVISVNTQFMSYCDPTLFFGQNLALTRLEDDTGALLIDLCEDVVTILGSGSINFHNFASTTHVLGDLQYLAASGDDLIWANAGNDTIWGSAGEDILHGGPGDDFINGGTEDDVLDGGSGTNVASFFPRVYADFTITVNGEDTIVEDTVGLGGIDTLRNFDRLEFADGYIENGGVFVPTREFIRGDANDDGVVDMSDPVSVLNLMFLGTPVPCEVALDANDDNTLDLSDPVYLLGYLLLAGAPEPPLPFGACGDDPTPVGPLGCLGFAGCP